MKTSFPRRILVRLTLLIALICLLTSGCSSNMFNKGVGGAAAGAASASLVGALTDLIVDGRVNTYRLQRNVVGGAIAGGAAGAAVGHRQDAAKAQAQQRQAPPDPPDKALIKEIGKDNYKALTDLVYYRHEDAYARTLKSVRSRNEDHQAAGYAIQALIDEDRNNPEGVMDAIEEFLKVSTEVQDMKEARKGLEDLTRELADERRVKGIRKPR
jgi:hypothetical protein